MRASIFVHPKSAAFFLSGVLILATGANIRRPVAAASPSSAPILLEGTVVTMSAGRDVIHGGRVLVRDGRIAAMWKRAKQ